MSKKLLLSLVLLLLPLATFADSDAYNAGYKVGRVLGFVCPFVCAGLVVALVVWLVMRNNKKPPGNG